MNPAGVSLTDVWKDISPVRHRKYKRRTEANELSIKLLDRVIRMASRPGDVVFDPFGGSGTTYLVAEATERKWLGIELGPIEQIIARLDPRNVELEQAFLEDYRAGVNRLFSDEVHGERVRRGHWVPGRIPKGVRKDFVPYPSEQAELILREPAAPYGSQKRPARAR